MTFSAVLDIAITLALLYLLLSLICSTVQEDFSARLNRRGWLLEMTIEQLLDRPPDARPNGWRIPIAWLRELFRSTRRVQSGDIGTSVEPGTATLADDVLDHGLVRGSMRGERLPSYLPPAIFAEALIDVLRARSGDNVATASGVRAAAELLPDGPARAALRALLQQSGDDLVAARRRIESWYEATMERAGGWYKRSTQLGLFVIGVSIAVGLNVDTVHIAARLYQDTNLRERLVVAAGEIEPATLENYTLAELRSELDALELPMGWPAPQLATGQASVQPASGTTPAAAPWSVYGLMGIGWLISALAISLGAPFWFSLLSRFLSVRGAGQKPAAPAGTQDETATAPAPADDAPAAPPVHAEPSIAANQFERSELTADDIRDIQRAMGMSGNSASARLDAETRAMIRAVQRRLGRQETGNLSPYVAQQILQG